MNTTLRTPVDLFAASAPAETPTPATLTARLTVARVLTGLLEHLERSETPVDAGQYRLVARRLADELATLKPDALMDAWMRRHPIATELYENTAFQYAGLCRQPLEAALAAEAATKAALARAAAP